jgi:putative ABC transport system permease protein
MRYLPLIWAWLAHKRVRTLSTIISLAVGFLLFGLLQGVDSAFSAAITRQRLDRLLIDPKFGLPALPLAYTSRIANLAHITDVAGTVFLQGTYQDPRNGVVVIGATPERYFAVRSEFQTTPEQMAALKTTRTGLLVMPALAERFGWKIGDKVTLRSTMVARPDGGTDYTFDVVGFMQNADNPTQSGLALANYEYLDESWGGISIVMRYIVKIDDPRRSAEVSRAVDALFDNSEAPTRTVTENERAQGQLASVGDVSLLTRGIISAVFFAILVMTGNMVLQSVRERVPQFAVLKTLGFHDSTVFVIVIAETVALCLVGAAVGLAAAAAIFPAVAAAIPSMSVYLSNASLSPQVVGYGFVWAAVLAVVSSAIPALMMLRLKIVDALIAH